MEHQNRLGSEKSPYLLQHKDNPVWWQPWGQEAFALARAEDKPIFLSVGYATCHWCHVMEHESFEDHEVAELLNERFVCIKVDREELPDVDQIYMSAVHAMGQRGGWPMSIVMTPDLKPFFGGTYFPKPNFMHIMAQLSKVWREDRSKVLDVAEELTGHLRSLTDMTAGDVVLDEGLLRRAYLDDVRRFDPVDGGFGQPPKFPPSMNLRVLLRIHRRTGSRKALEMVETTLDRMARGGMYDHLGGGFARYSTDKTWLVPHFEKMLYDNALLSAAYLEAFQVTGNPMYAAVARETLDYVLRDMTSPEGGFYSAEDADSEGHEGKFYVWTREELEHLLTKEELEKIVEVYGVIARGNFEHHTNILNLQRTFPWSVKEEPVLASAHRKLFEAREKRIHPLKDDKQLTAWNGLMMASMALAGQVLGDERYLEAARRSARFLKAHLWKDRTLFRRFRDGEARYEGTLDDYAYLVHGLITLYQTDFDPCWIDWAIELQAWQDTFFWDQTKGGYFYTPADAKDLLVRTRDYTDNATPNGNAVAALSLLQLHHLTYECGYREKAETIMRAAGILFSQHPQAFAQLLIALDFHLDFTKEVVISGEADSLETQAALEALHRTFLPNKVLALAASGLPGRLPILQEKPMIDGKTTLYVCEGFTCKLPTNVLEQGLKLVEERKPYDLTGG